MLPFVVNQLPLEVLLEEVLEEVLDVLPVYHPAFSASCAVAPLAFAALYL